VPDQVGGATATIRGVYVGSTLAGPPAPRPPPPPPPRPGHRR
jgi:hypothetical protein